MAFNFKEALEKSRTPVGKAEDFLKETLKVIKKMNSFNELSFNLSAYFKGQAPYSIYSVAENGNILYRVDKIMDYNEAVSIFKALERLLQRDYAIEPVASSLVLSSFKIQI